MRDPIKVFTSILETFPSEYLSEDKKELFNWYIIDASYKAPELWPEVYLRFSDFLHSILPPKLVKKEQATWMIKVYSIFSTLSEEVILKVLNN